MLSFTAHKFGHSVLFRCAGRFVSGDAERLGDAIRAQSRAKAIVLDLIDISTIDAAGVGMLASLHASAQADGRGFKLMNLAPRVEEVIEITNLKSVLEVCSVGEMLDLLCEAIRQTKSELPVDVETSEKLAESVLLRGRSEESDGAGLLKSSQRA